MLTALSLLPFHCTRNIALAPAIKFFVSCIKVLQSCDAVMDIHCIEWKETTKETMIAQFQTPTVMLKSYSGDTLNVVAQLPMILGQGDQGVLSVVLIQKDAPQDLLIGTDLQPALGYVLTVRKSGNQETVLLGNYQSDKHQNGAARESSKSQESDTVVVKLLTATKVSAGHRKLVRAKVDGWLSDNLALFMPTAMNSELRIADAAVQADGEGFLKLIAETVGVATWN